MSYQQLHEHCHKLQKKHEEIENKLQKKIKELERRIGSLIPEDLPTEVYKVRYSLLNRGHHNILSYMNPKDVTVEEPNYALYKCLAEMFIALFDEELDPYLVYYVNHSDKGTGLDIDFTDEVKGKEVGPTQFIHIIQEIEGGE